MLGHGSLFFAGTGLGLLGLVYYERLLAARTRARSVGAMAATECAEPTAGSILYV